MQVLALSSYKVSVRVFLHVGETDLIGVGKGLEPVMLLLLVSGRGLDWDVFVFGLFDRNGIRHLQGKNID